MRHFLENNSEQQASIPELEARGSAVPTFICHNEALHIGLLAVLVIASLALGICLVPAIAQDTPIPIDQYWLGIEAALASIEDLRQVQADDISIRAELDAMAGQMEAINRVALEDGTVIPIDHSYIVSLLRADPTDLKSIEDTLRAMLEHRERRQTSKEGISPSAWGQMQRQLEGILSREEFQWKPAAPNPIREWLNKIVRRLLDWFTSLLPSEIVVGRGFMQWVAGAVMLLALLVVAWFVIRSISAGLVSEADLDKQWDERGVVTADGALKNAQETARAGDYRSAVRWLYLSSLLILEEHNLLRYDRSRTNREYLRSVAHRPELSTILRDVIDVFDRVWYGFQPIEPDDYDHYVKQVTQLRRLR
ncbi:MAG: DUF4129 domain-containing protein [Anaerolineae bacterium]|nr:DUF4129 domain-containing protein [Anaerolineae bacterium]